MKEHILLEEAKRYDVDTNLNLNGCTFLSKDGYWEDDNTREPMMFGENPRRAQSKKCDIETGEDQKGE